MDLSRQGALRLTPGLFMPRCTRVIHRTSRHKNKRSEQDHRSVKHRYDPLRGFGACASAARFCTGFAEQRQYFRAVARSGEAVSLGDRRRVFQERWATIMAEVAAS